MKYVVRKRYSSDNIIIESTRTLNFFYRTIFGRLLLNMFISKTFSNAAGKYMNSKFSKHRINNFVRDNKIIMTEYEKDNFSSYNDFFIRKIVSYKRPIAANKDFFISPCDSKLTAYKICKDLTLKIKGSYYTISSLVEKNIVSEYKNGYALVFRLSPDDYHRYCYIDSGTKSKNYHINGKYHTVQPIALEKNKFYKTNNREYTILYTNNFDKIVYVEVGAMTIGKIHNHHEEYKYKKGEEKGYFEFGGSTIVLLVKDNIIKIDEDIINNSKDNIETIVKYGERIAKKISS